MFQIPGIEVYRGKSVGLMPVHPLVHLEDGEEPLGVQRVVLADEPSINNAFDIHPAAVPVSCGLLHNLDARFLVIAKDVPLDIDICEYDLMVQDALGEPDSSVQVFMTVVTGIASDLCMKCPVEQMCRVTTGNEYEEP